MEKPLVKRLARHAVGIMGLLTGVATIVVSVHFSLPKLPPSDAERRGVVREHSVPLASSIDDVLAARDVRLPDGSTAEQVLLETVRWAERVTRLERSLATDSQESQRRVHDGCQFFTSALMDAVRRSEPWGAPLTALLQSSNALAQGSREQKLSLLRDIQRHLVQLQSALTVQSPRPRLAQLLEAEEFTRLSQLVTSSPLLQNVCTFDSGELERRYASEISWAIVEAEHGSRLADEWVQVADVVGAFLELELLTLPAPDRCDLSSEREFEWVPEALDAAAKVLKHLPLATVKRLLELDEEGLAPSVRQVSRALPVAACEKVTQLVCSQLKRARVEQRETASVAALRLRAQSLTAAHDSLIQLARDGRAHGCESLGVADAEAYASRLVSEGHALVLGSAPRLAERVRRFAAASEGEGGVREQVLGELRHQRMELAAVGLGIVEPGLRYLVEAGKLLEPTSAVWRTALLTIEGRRDVLREPPFTDSGLEEFERLLSLLLMRNNELCELTTSSSVSAILGDRVGVFYDLGRALISELARGCRES